LCGSHLSTRLVCPASFVLKANSISSSNPIYPPYLQTGHSLGNIAYKQEVFMDRREFSALLPMLFAAPALASAAEAQLPVSPTAAALAALPKLASGQYT
jgi:hypothetical protein